MNAKTCTICGQLIDGKRIEFKVFVENMDLSHKHQIGYQCQHCGALYCVAGKKKDHPKRSWWSGYEKVRCPECGDSIGPSYAILSQDAPEIEESREPIGETAPIIEKHISSQISEMLDAREWEEDTEVQEQLLELLKVNGEAFLVQCLEDINSDSIWPRETTRIKKVMQVGSVAEVGALWLFEDGEIEEMLIHRVEEKYLKGVQDHSKHEFPESILTYLISALLSIEAATRSGKSIPAIIDNLLNNEIVYFRTETAKQLGVVDWDSRVVDALIEALNDKKRPHRESGSLWIATNKAPSVQERAIVSLINICDERGLSAVIPILAEEPTFARQTEIEFSGEDSVNMLTEVGLRAPHLLTHALEHGDMSDVATIRVANALRHINNPDVV